MNITLNLSNIIYHPIERVSQIRVDSDIMMLDDDKGVLVNWFYYPEADRNVIISIYEDLIEDVNVVYIFS